MPPAVGGVQTIATALPTTIEARPVGAWGSGTLPSTTTVTSFDGGLTPHALVARTRT